MEILINLITLIKHLPLLFKSRRSGLKKRKLDGKEYKISELGWFGYTPKKNRHEIKAISIKDQRLLLTCQWVSTTVQKEPDEKMILSARSLVIKGLQMGLVGRKGLSNLGSGPKVLQKWGILTEKTCPDISNNNWNEYINFAVDVYKDEAARHKIKSYWFINNVNDVYKLLDDGRIVVVGMPWYSGFNQSGGFSMPWLIWKIIGWYVGGHAYIVKGYDRNYNGKRVFICQNSYSERWGDNGDFYVEEGYMQKHALNKYGGVVTLDADDIQEPWIKEAEAIYNRVKAKYVYIIRPESHGEYYELDDDGLHYTKIAITRLDGTTAKTAVEFDEFLRKHPKFTGVSENDFNLLSRYLKLNGKKVGLKKEK